MSSSLQASLRIAGSLIALTAFIDAARSEEIGASPMQRVADGGEVIGTSELVRDFTERRVSMTLNTRELRRNAPYTVWWVVFNDPSLCANPCACGPDDLSNPGEIGIGVFWATGGTSDRFGQATFAAQIDEGEVPEGEDQVPFIEGVQFDRPIEDAEEAEIHLVVRDHGPLQRALLEEQITQFDGGCPAGGCFDRQFSVHQSLSCEIP